MKKTRFTVEQISYTLRQAEAGMLVADVCRQMGISEATFYVWKKKYGELGVSELRQMRQMVEENARLKRLVADLTLDKQILQDVIKKSFEASPSSRAGSLDPRTPPRQRAPLLQAGAHPLIDVVLRKPDQGSIGAANANTRTRAESTAI